MNPYERINLHSLLAILAIINNDTTTTVPQLALQLEISDSAITRVLRKARTSYGVKLTWQRNVVPQRWQIEDFGVFDRQQVYRWAKQEGYL